MLHNNVTNSTNVGVLYNLCNITAELQCSFSNAYNKRNAKNYRRNATSAQYNPFNILNNFRRICTREIAEVTGE